MGKSRQLDTVCCGEVETIRLPIQRGSMRGMCMCVCACEGLTWFLLDLYLRIYFSLVLILEVLYFLILNSAWHC